MKEHSEPSKEETKLQSEQKPQLRSAEEILENHYWRVYGQSHDTYVTNYRINSATHHTVLIGAMKEYASQFKSHSPIEQKAFKEKLAIEVLARFTGNSRGTPIAKNGFIDGALWAQSQPLPIEGVERELSEKEFCRMYTEYHGEEIDKIQQLVSAKFTGEELMEFVQHCLATRK